MPLKPGGAVHPRFGRIGKETEEGKSRFRGD